MAFTGASPSKMLVLAAAALLFAFLPCIAAGSAPMLPPTDGSSPFLEPPPKHLYPRSWQPSEMQHDNDIEVSNITLQHSPYRRYKRGPSRNWGFSLGGVWDVANNQQNPAYHVFPDAHITVVSNTDGGFITFWSECENYRTQSGDRWLDSSGYQNPYTPWPNIYFGGRRDYRGFDNGGKWLLSVHRHPTDGNPNHFIGFYHAEDGYWPRFPAGGPAWKSVGVVHSWDQGITWTDYGQIVTSSHGRPSDDNAYYGGIGNQIVAWDKGSNRWIMIFAEHQMGAAISHDPNAYPNTWFKWTGDGFHSPGLYGHYVPLPGLDWVPGSNPSLHWNTLIEKWVIIFNSWDNMLHISASDDGIHWESVRTLTGSMDGTRAWYSSVVSPEGASFWGGNYFRLYYADRFAWPDIRRLVQRDLHFWRGD